MEPVEFWKMNGSGNDFILVDNRDGGIAESEMALWVQRVCRRRESVGADGAIFVVGSKTHDFKWRFFNADGSEAEMCGNGGRCVARFAFLTGIAGSEMRFETLAGTISAQVRGRMVKVRMPRATGLKTDLDVGPISGASAVDFVHTGVPHAVVHVPELENYPVVEQGRRLRWHARFQPQGANVNFMKPMGPGAIAVRTYERGVEDETLACGTGAMACAILAARRHGMSSPVQVNTRGGEILVVHLENGGPESGRVWLEGSTAVVYRGSLEPEAL